jgi:uncharacterized RmlC-like cupin family protein
VHRHLVAEEAFYVVDGRLAFALGDQRLEAGSGTFVLIPAGVAHGFANPGAEPATLLVLVSPPGHERYVAELAAILAELAAILATPGRPDTDAIADLRRRHDTEQVSPLVA